MLNRVRVQDDLPARRLQHGSLDPQLPKHVVPERRRVMQRHRRRLQYVPVEKRLIAAQVTATAQQR